MMADLGIAEIRAEGRRLLADFYALGPEDDGFRQDKLTDFLFDHLDVLLADPAPVGRDDVAHDEGWAIAIISNVDAPEVGWPQQTEEWRTAARSWLDSVHAPASSAPVPVGLTEDERDLVEALRLGWGDSAAVESLLAIIDRLSAAPDDRERVPEGWRVEWRVVDVTDEGDHTYTGEAVPTLGPVSPSVDPKKEP